MNHQSHQQSSPRVVQLVMLALVWMQGSMAGAAVESTIQAQSDPFVAGAYFLSAEHYAGFRKEVDPSTVFTLGGSREWNDWDGFLTQPAVKYYRVIKGDPEFELVDTVFGASRDLPELFTGWSQKVTLSSTLPVSDFSNDQDVITKPKVSWAHSRTFFNDRLSYSLTPTFRYYVNRYETTQTGIGTGGGIPLRQYMWTIDQSAVYSFSPMLTFSAFVSYVQIHDHEIGKRNRVATNDENVLLSEDYSLNLAVNYQVNQRLTLSAGYDQSDSVERAYGLQKIYAFDEYNSQWFASASMTL
jgi:hypothetical protein